MGLCNGYQIAAWPIEPVAKVPRVNYFGPFLRMVQEVNETIHRNSDDRKMVLLCFDVLAQIQSFVMFLHTTQGLCLKPAFGILFADPAFRRCGRIETLKRFWLKLVMQLVPAQNSLATGPDSNEVLVLILLLSLRGLTTTLSEEAASPERGGWRCLDVTRSNDNSIATTAPRKDFIYLADEDVYRSSGEFIFGDSFSQKL